MTKTPQTTSPPSNPEVLTTYTVLSPLGATTIGIVQAPDGARTCKLTTLPPNSADRAPEVLEQWGVSIPSEALTKMAKLLSPPPKPTKTTQEEPENDQ